MMMIYKYTIRTWLILRYCFHWVSRTGCFGRSQAVHFSPGRNEKTGNTIRAGLFRHHVKQFHESSCSVASVVSAVNALLEKTRGPQAVPLTQRAILEKVRAAHWKERMGPNGYKGRRGLPLTVLGQVVRASLDAYGLSGAGVEVIQARGGRDSIPVKNRLRTLLKEFQDKDNCLLIAHFDQGSFVRELNIPHISPVGGFDPETCQVTILDVDPCQPRPYKLPFRTFYKGISTCYGGVFSLFDYGRGGVVLIRLNPPEART
ncbi:MAG: phytochelatin synthase family protein [Desulfobacterales bacterium]|nr:phytochelatin synthase family protein [Desulfobacterales bacterium]